MLQKLSKLLRVCYSRRSQFFCNFECSRAFTLYRWSYALVPIIVPAYAALLAFIYIFLSSRVIQSRVVTRIGIGTGGHRGLERRMRIHANFAEYVPLALLLLAFMEMEGRPGWLVHLLCAALVVARIGHVIALWEEKEILWLRIATVSATFFIMAAAAVSVLARALQLW